MQLFVRGASMLYNQRKVNNGETDPYNRIADGIFIGMIPSKESKVYKSKFDDQHKKIIAFAHKLNPDRPITLVVSVVERDELDGKGFPSIKSMVSPEDWKKENVEHKLLVMVDFTASINKKDAINTIFQMRKHIIDGGGVYAHCKAGRSRSAMIWYIYLRLFGTNPTIAREMSPKETLRLMKKERVNLDLDQGKQTTAEEIIREIKLNYNYRLHSILPAFNCKIMNIINQFIFDETRFIDLIESEETKADILKLSAAGELAMYAVEHDGSFFQSHRSLCIKEFIQSLKNPNGDRWLYEMTNAQGKLALLSDANPNLNTLDEKNKDAIKRRELVKHMREQAIQYISDKMGCDKQEVINAANKYKI